MRQNPLGVFICVFGRVASSSALCSLLMSFGLRGRCGENALLQQVRPSMLCRIGLILALTFFCVGEGLGFENINMKQRRLDNLRWDRPKQPTLANPSFCFLSNIIISFAFFCSVERSGWVLKGLRLFFNISPFLYGSPFLFLFQGIYVNGNDRAYQVAHFFLSLSPGWPST